MRTEELESERAAAITAVQAVNLRAEELQHERLQAKLEEELEELERERVQAQVDEETKRRTDAGSSSVQGEFGDEKFKPRQETFNHTNSNKKHSY